MAGLGDKMAAAVLRAEDFDRASKFYTDVLGLMPGPDMGTVPTRQGMFMAGKGTAVMIYERPGMPAPVSTTLGFAISADEFDAVAADLRAKGVKFEDYDMPEIGLKTVDGIVDMDGNKAAWFKDTEGNILNIAVM
jgi:predicted enzyme related to lactoylglutathione lyase